MANKQFDLTLEEALPRLDAELLKHRAETDREQLKDISSDDAYDLGYELAIQDLRSLTGPNPMEIGIMVVKMPETTNE
jgi:hypothetical protein